MTSKIKISILIALSCLSGFFIALIVIPTRQVEVEVAVERNVEIEHIEIVDKKVIVNTWTNDVDGFQFICVYNDEYQVVIAVDEQTYFQYDIGQLFNLTYK